MRSAPNGSGSGSNWGLIVTLPVCIVLAIFFVLSSLKTTNAPADAAPLDPAWYTPTTARGEDLKLKVMVGNCFLCHAYWTGPPDPEVVRPQFAHAIIQLAHGSNDRCYNCHLIQDRNKYTANDGSGIMPANVDKLCARCHGLIHNDWLAGTHGVRWGKWSPQTGFERTNFVCTECHDPHAPRFEFKTYAPPPVWPQRIVRTGGIAHAQPGAQ